MAEDLIVIPQFDALRHEWRRFPILADAINRAQDIVTYPENYVMSTNIDIYQTSNPLTKEDLPLSAIQLFYKLNEREERILNQTIKWNTFLSVGFHLCDTISTPHPSQFSAHIMVIDSVVDKKGRFIPSWTISDELTVRPSLTGSKLRFLNPWPIRVGEERMKDTLKELTNLQEPMMPQLTEAYTWTGIHALLTPISGNTFTP